MVKIPEDVLKIIDKEWSFDSNIFSQEDVYNFTEALRENAELAGTDWTYDSGVTKLVLIFPHLDFVIKIPFTGEIDSDGYFNHCENCDYCYEECSTMPSACKGCEYRYDHYRGMNSDSDYSDYCCADTCGNKTLTHNWDYCEAEVWYANKAKEAGLIVCFAETKLLGYVDGHPIYVQPKAQIYCDCYSSKYDSHTDEQRADTKKACERLNSWCFNVDWLTDFLLFYGDDMFQKFMNFIKEYQIRDLHTGNVGYVDGLPVLVDYGGFEG